MKIWNLRTRLKFWLTKPGLNCRNSGRQNPKEQATKELFLRINDFAARFYHQVLLNEKQGKEALEILTNRGLTKKTIEQWQIGFAPNDFHSFRTALVKKGVDLTQANKAGVLTKNERGQIYDRFRGGALLFPVFDYLGQVVGFPPEFCRLWTTVKWASI